MNKEEDDAPCAAREVRLDCRAAVWQDLSTGLLEPCAQVYEETGFDITGLTADADYVETVYNQQRTKLFIVPDIDEQVCRKRLLCCGTRSSSWC